MHPRSIGALTHEGIARLGKTSVLILPLGSMEQHGPHLPLETDTILADALAQAIVQRQGDAFDLWLLPTLAYGLSREHAWAAGTMTLSVNTMAIWLRELGAEIVRALPARNLMILNAHGGNRGILDAVIYELKDDFGLNVCVVHTGALMSPVPEAGCPEIHGGCDETSVMLALAPERVRMDRTAELRLPPDNSAVRAIVLDPGVTWPWSSGDSSIADRGVMGDAASASAEQGQAIVARIVAAAADALSRLTGRPMESRR